MLEKYCVIMSRKSAQRVALYEIASKTKAAISVIAYVVTLRGEKQLGSAGLEPETPARLARQSGALSMPHGGSSPCKAELFCINHEDQMFIFNLKSS